ncbi:MAG: deoxyribodipyrimidine photo-lyase/cryptochrome family protein [Planctomycetaceae bacterium]
MTVQLVWFKKDLRTIDHRPLAAAARAGLVLCVYVLEPEQLRAEDADERHWGFLRRSLMQLDARLRRLGTRLVLLQGDLPGVFAWLHSKCGLARIWCHEETGNFLSYQRDRRVRAWCRANAIPIEEVPQSGVVRRLASRDGWSAIWRARMREPIVEEPQSIRCGAAEFPGELCGQSVVPQELQPDAYWREGVDGLSGELQGFQEGGCDAGERYLQTFLELRGADYRRAMSSPVTGEQGCSRLSPYLAFGNLSIRQVVQRSRARLLQVREDLRGGVSVDESWTQSLASFESRLSWHCHFMQKLEDEPQLEFRNVNRAFDGLRENEFREEWFRAWQDGQTGYPMVDACMRALRSTGWINFRMRAMVMSFAAYHLWLHWRRPALHLARMFTDYEPGIHYSQCQMQSGVTGINTIRIYSPAKQARDQDPSGLFIRRWVPELDGVPDEFLAEPHRMSVFQQSLFGCRIGRDYPVPLVEHESAYRLARDRIFAAVSTSAARQAAAAVYERHGSRRRPLTDGNR